MVPAVRRRGRGSAPGPGPAPRGPRQPGGSWAPAAGHAPLSPLMFVSLRFLLSRACYLVMGHLPGPLMTFSLLLSVSVSWLYPSEELLSFEITTVEFQSAFPCFSFSGAACRRPPGSPASGLLEGRPLHLGPHSVTAAPGPWQAPSQHW